GGRRLPVAVPVAEGDAVALLAERPAGDAGVDDGPVDRERLGAPVAVDVGGGRGDRRAVDGDAIGLGDVRLVAGPGPGGGPGTGEGQGGGRHTARADEPAGGPDGAVAARATRRRPARLVRSVRPVPRVSPGRGRGQRQRERPGTAAA